MCIVPLCVVLEKVAFWEGKHYATLLPIIGIIRRMKNKR